ncbi:MAG: hypothetical protein HZA93_07585 [Verrucomicrobia bacterium]|nr:hypothetical protein [Verrucomicrobiota bacterium]
MDFLTLHELSVQLDVSVRVLRHRLRQLLTEGQLVENRDCRRDDYVDPTHFVWRVDPVAFIRVTGLQPVTTRANQPPLSVTPSANQTPPPATNAAEPKEQTLPKADTKPPGMEREMIDLLKDQVRVKDGQLVELSTQNKTLTALNEKLTGAVVHQSEQIRNLLRLTGGKTEMDEFAAESDSKSGNTANRPGNASATHEHDFGNQPVGRANEQGSARAA